MTEHKKKPRPKQDRGHNNSTYLIKPKINELCKKKHVSDCQHATKQTAAGNADHLTFSDKRLLPVYPVMPPAANLFVIAGILVRHGLSAALVVRGYRS